MTKYLFLDLETTGVDPQQHGIIQIAFQIVTNYTEFSWSAKLQPFGSDVVSLDALKITRHTAEDLKTFPSPIEVYHRMRKVLTQHVDPYNPKSKFTLVAYNAVFDDSFLRAYFQKCGDKYYGSLFSWPPLDVAGLTAFFYRHDRLNFPNFRLTTVAQRLGLIGPEEAEKAHDAAFDVEVTRRLFNYLVTTWEKPHV